MLFFFMEFLKICAFQSNTVDTTQPIANRNQFGVVFKSKLDRFRLFYAAETDCCDAATEKLIEIKTQQELQNDEVKLGNFYR